MATVTEQTLDSKDVKALVQNARASIHSLEGILRKIGQLPKAERIGPLSRVDSGDMLVIKVLCEELAVIIGTLDRDNSFPTLNRPSSIPRPS